MLIVSTILAEPTIQQPDPYSLNSPITVPDTSAISQLSRACFPVSGRVGIVREGGDHFGGSLDLGLLRIDVLVGSEDFGE